MSRRIKIVHIITRLDQGGSGDVVMTLAGRMDQERFEVQIITGRTLEPVSDLAEYQKRTGVPVTEYPYMRRNIMPLYDALTGLYLIHRLWLVKPDIVHTHTSKAGILGRIAAAVTGVPIIIHAPHGHIFYGYFGRFISSCFIWIEKWIARFTDRIITLTKLGAQDHIHYGVGSPEQFLSIPCGVDLSRFTDAEKEGERLRQDLAIDPDLPMILWVGRLVPIKGCDVFLKACAIVTTRLPDARIFILGDGYLADSLKLLATEQGLDDHLRFMGHRSDRAIWMWAADLFVLSSINEGLGRVIVEAMSTHTPVVATAVGGVGEIIQDGITGLLVPPSDPEKLAEAMLYLLEDSANVQRMGDQGSKRAQDFDAQHMINKTVALYDELLKEKNLCAA
ncbi:MAG: glycosyltransferase family 4 protein [Gemmatimonadota bacterium]|nr:glycosyltransferase family 4 protein [Gemmatimonadota bacterium]